MPYLIDGHNLIPKIRGLELSDPDDEERLIEILVGFSKRIDKSIEVYFDGAYPGMSRQTSFGAVRAFFIRRGKTADTAIIRRLRELGGDARNWIVVSSDRQVQIAAGRTGARTLKSEDFSSMIEEIRGQSEPSGKDSPIQSQDEIDEWLHAFGDDSD